MAIVLKYGAPGPILQAGFAAGVGHRKNVQTEDNLKIWQQQQYQDFHANQSALQRQQTAALQQQHQTFQANQNADNQAFQKYQGDMNRRFQTDREDRLRLEGNLDDQKRFNRQRFFALKPIPDHADGETRKMLTKHRAALSELMGPQWDQMDPKVQQAFQEEHDAYVAGVTALEAHAPRAITHIDPRGNEFEQPAVDPETGLTTTQPYDKKTLKPIDNPQAEAMAKAQVEAQKQQKEAAAAAQKQAEKLAADTQKWLEKRHATALRIQNDNTPASSETKPPLDFAAAEKEMEAAGFTRPQQAAPQAPAASPTQGQPDFSKDTYPTPPAQETFSGEPAVAPFTGSTAGGPGTYGQPVPAASQYPPEARQAILGGSQLPRPSSKEEADSLGPGASWVAPDGTIRRNP